MYYIAEAADQAAADRVQQRIAKMLKAFGARELPTTIPFGLRYGPYLNVGEIMANREGEVNFPINAKFQASKAVDAMKAFEALPPTMRRSCKNIRSEWPATRCSMAISGA